MVTHGGRGREGGRERGKWAVAAGRQGRREQGKVTPTPPLTTDPLTEHVQSQPSSPILLLPEGWVPQPRQGMYAMSLLLIRWMTI